MDVEDKQVCENIVSPLIKTCLEVSMDDQSPCMICLTSLLRMTRQNFVIRDTTIEGTYLFQNQMGLEYK